VFALQLEPVINWIRQTLKMKPVHMDTKPHEAHPEEDAAIMM
jgi:hypothetical protein